METIGAGDAGSESSEVGHELSDLRARERRLRLAQDAAELGSWEWEVTSGHVTWSEGLQRLHGLEPGSFGGTFDDFRRDIFPADLPLVEAAIERAFQSGRHEVEYRIVLPDRSVRWVRARGRVLFDANRRPQRVVGVCMDDTARKRADQALQVLADVSERLTSSLDYHSTLGALAELLVPRVADGCLMDVQVGRHEERFGATIRDQIDKPLSGAGLAAIPSANFGRGRVVLVPKLDRRQRVRDTSVRRHCETLAKAGYGSVLISPLVAHDRQLGTLTLVRETDTPPFDERDSELAFLLCRRIALALDNARLFLESETIRDQLERANQVKDEFLDSVSHEMRTPLTIIHAGLNLIRRRQAELDPTEVSRLIGELEEESRELQGMVENLLALARAEGTERPDLEPCRLDRLLQKVTTDFAERHPARRFALDVSLLPMVASHPPSLERVMRNLLSNAVKYSPAQSTVTVEACATDASVVVRIEDQGAGIATEELERIFDRFYRSPSNSFEASGTGVGLALCRRLAESVGGRIWAEQGSGRGLTIVLSLPLYQTVAHAVET